MKYLKTFYKRALFLAIILFGIPAMLLFLPIAWMIGIDLMEWGKSQHFERLLETP